jgi:hypothetical protein
VLNPQPEATREAAMQDLDKERAAFEKFERELKEIEKRILKVSGIQPDLNTLAKAGADKKRVLEILALAVFDQNTDWPRVIERKREALRRLAQQLRTVTIEAEQLAEDPLCGGLFWLALCGLIGWDEVKWPTKKSPNSTFGRMMRMLAKHEEDLARQLGEIARKAAFHNRRSAIAALIYYIRESTGRNDDDVVARLLTDAHEAVGLSRQFSADSLAQVRKRHLEPLLRLLRQSQTAQ